MKIIEHMAIEYGGRMYPAVLVELKDRDGMVVVSTISLERVLLINGKYADTEAELVDSKVYYYTDDENIFRDDLAEILEKEIF